MNLKDLLNHIASEFQKTYDRAPRWIAAAPGRVNLIGEHTDYNDGFGLPMAIERYAIMAADAAAAQLQLLPGSGHSVSNYGVNSRRQDLAERMPRLEETIGIFKQISKEEGVGFIDPHKPLIGKPELMTPGDGPHPNKAGHAATAWMVARALKETSR